MYIDVHNEKTACFDTEDSPNGTFAELSIAKFRVFCTVGYSRSLDSQMCDCTKTYISTSRIVATTKRHCTENYKLGYTSF